MLTNIPRACLARSAAMLVAASVLSGCAAFSQDRGMSVVTTIAAEQLDKDVAVLRTPEDAVAARAAVERLLRRPLSADAAVQIALLNNRGLQAAYAELAAAEAQMVEQSLPPNPRISVSRIASSAEIEIDRQIVTDILALATLPARSETARLRFRQAQLRAALETLRLAADTRRAYYQAVANREIGEFLAQAQTSAEAGTQLAKRLGETGAMNKLDQAREHVFYAELTAQLATARQRGATDREALTRLLGLWGNDTAFKLPNALPGLPRTAQSLASIEVEAVRRRVDLQIARVEVDALAKAYGLTQATRFVNLLEAGYADKIVKDRETGRRTTSRGFDVEVQIPIFDFGEVRVREVEAVYMQAVNRLLEKAVNVRSEARDVYRSYRATYDIASHYQKEVLPLRKIISDETLLRYNAMLIDVFSLLAEARQRINAINAAIEAKRDFWMAQTALATAVLGGGAPNPANEGSRSTTVAESGGTGH